MVIIRRIALNIDAPTAMYQPLITRLDNVFVSNAISVATGVMAHDSVPIETVQFVLNQGISWMIVHLNVYPYPKQPLCMEDLPLLPSNSPP